MTQINSSRPWHQLTANQRGEIQALREQGLKQSQIAAQIGCHRSTICRELRRGRCRQRNSNYQLVWRYYGDTAQTLHQQRRRHCYQHTLLEKAHFFFQELTKVQQDHEDLDGIDEFIGLFKQTYAGLPCPSTPTVYRYIDQGKLKIKDIDLPLKVKRREHQRKQKHQAWHKRFGPTIDQRPVSVNRRQDVGHWEGDLVKGHRDKNQPALMTLTERKTRFEVVIKIPDYHATTCLKALQQEVNQHSDWFKSITFDNGSEFALLNQVHGTKIYYAHPYSPWERGSNENGNGLLRRFFPKGASLAKYSSAYVRKAAWAINHKHRRILNYETAAQLFHDWLSS